MKTLALAAIVALFATATFADDPRARPGGYNDQVKAGSLVSPVGACAPTSPTLIDTNGDKPGGQFIVECGKDTIPVSAS